MFEKKGKGGRLQEGGGGSRHRIRRKENNGKLIFQVNELWGRRKGKEVIRAFTFQGRAINNSQCFTFNLVSGGLGFSFLGLLFFFSVTDPE
jgi:hypothetical protein